MPKKLPINIFVRYRHYAGDGTVGLNADTSMAKIVDQDETCEIGIYVLKKTVKAKNSTSIVNLKS